MVKIATLGIGMSGLSTKAFLLTLAISSSFYGCKSEKEAANQTVNKTSVPDTSKQTSSNSSKETQSSTEKSSSPAPMEKESTNSGDQSLPIEPSKEINLAGKKFTRTWETLADPFTGSPGGTVSQSIEFDKDGIHVTDDGSTLFGNAPERGTYEVDGEIILLKFESDLGFGASRYFYSEAQGKLTAEVGTIFLEK